MEINNLPIIDWDAVTKLVGQPELAQNMVDTLVHRLSSDIVTIKALYQQKKHEELWQQVHKLHGALCYCGLPRLKYLVGQLESDLKKHIMNRLPSLFDQLDQEVALLLQHYAHCAAHPPRPS